MTGRIAFTIAITICSGALAQSVRAPHRADDEATRLIQNAAEADTYGDNTLRDSLLREALEIDANNDLARWQSGQVYFNGEWRSIDEVGEFVSHDRRRDEYRRLVVASDSSPQAHEALARWCARHRLDGEERWHWLNVLQADPNHAAALERLGFERYEGQLYRQSQIAELKQAKRNLRKFRPEMERLVRAAEKREGIEREELLAQLASVSDPAAIAALSEAVRVDDGDQWRLKRELGEKESHYFVQQLHLAAVNALSNMPEYNATVKLVEVAVLSDDAEVRRRAAEALIPRDKTDYMPLMMDGLESLLELSVRIDTSPGGAVQVVEELYEAGQKVDRSMVRRTDYLSARITREEDGRIVVENKAEEDESRADAHASRTEAWVEQQNEARRNFNARVEEALQTITGLALGSDAERWWENWGEYNDMDSSYEKPVIETAAYDNYYEREYRDEYRGPAVPECFVAGTLVWTQSGPKAIENIEAGTLVLSQDPITGRLDYRPVMETTTRPPSAVVKIYAEGQEFIATRGHRFWVSGDGWRMAKFLKPGDRVHSVRGSIEITSVESVEDAEVFNLVVDDFHTFFVGERQLLVHDAELPQPTTNILPGIQGRSRTVAE